jgi:hypothetical protein
MRRTTLVQVLIFLVIAAGLGYLVVSVAKGWAGWVVFGGILVATYGVMIAYNNRKYPAQTTKRSVAREPGESYLPSSKQGRDV